MSISYQDLEAMLGKARARELWEKSNPLENPASFSKYKNTKTEIDGIKFDSLAEADYFLSLQLLKRAGEVLHIELQPVFILQEKFSRKGKSYQAITYRADFKITYKNGEIEIVDVKGFETDVYKNKRKMFLKRFPEFLFVEIMKGERREY